MAVGESSDLLPNVREASYRSAVEAADKVTLLGTFRSGRRDQGLNFVGVITLQAIRCNGGDDVIVRLARLHGRISEGCIAIQVGGDLGIRTARMGATIHVITLDGNGVRTPIEGHAVGDRLQTSS